MVTACVIFVGDYVGEVWGPREEREILGVGVMGGRVWRYLPHELWGQGGDYMARGRDGSGGFHQAFTGIIPGDGADREGSRSLSQATRRVSRPQVPSSQQPQLPQPLPVLPLQRFQITQQVGARLPGGSQGWLSSLSAGGRHLQSPRQIGRAHV